MAGSRKTSKKKNTGSGSGGKARSSSSRTRTVKRETSTQAARKRSFLRREVLSIVLVAAGCFFFLTELGFMGAAGKMLRSFQSGLFGSVGILFGILLIVMAVTSYIERGKSLRNLKLMSEAGLLICISAAAELAAGEADAADGIAFLRLYTSGASGVSGGGAIGGSIALALGGALGGAGAWLIILTLFLIFIVAISEVSLVDLAAMGAAKTADIAGQGAARTMEAASRSRERRAQRREQREREAFSAGDASVTEDTPSANRRGGSLSGVQLSGDGDVAVNQDFTDTPAREDGGTAPAGASRYMGEIKGQGADTANTVQAENPPEPGLKEEPYSESLEDNAVVRPYPQEIDYDVDTVPFDEVINERYKSYAGISGGIINIQDGADAGYAVGSLAGNAYLRPEGGLSGDMRQDAAGALEGTDPGSGDGTIEDARVLSYGDAAPLQDIHSLSYEENVSSAEGYEEEIVIDPGSTEGGDAYEDLKVSDMEPDPFIDVPAGDDDKTAAEPLLQEEAVPEEKISYSPNKGQEKKPVPGAVPRQTAPAVLHPGTGADMKKPEEPPEKPYVFPSPSLLEKGRRGSGDLRSEVKRNASKLEQVLRDFGVGVTVTNVIRGPRVSRYEMIPDTGVKVSSITSLSGDIRLALAASEMRIEAPIPGKSAVGIEIPNSESQTVRFRDILESDEFRNFPSPLSWGIGLDIQGSPVVADIAKMPHMLVAGTTGSGKSVGINSLIMSILYKASPDDVRMILVDPKVVELSVYNGIPHLLTDVVTKPDRALSALNWAVAEMNNRYKLFQQSATRNISGYNKKIAEANRRLDAMGDEGERAKKLPYILIVIDELSELMMHAKKDVESAIVSLTQLARAAGIHLVVATQRPSVDVVTGLIKSNIPSRIAYRLPSATDSRTILDSGGAETLLGNGDMLYKPGDRNSPARIQGAFLSDAEIEAVVDFVRKENTASSYGGAAGAAASDRTEPDFGSEPQGPGSFREEPERDSYFADAGRLIINSKKASIGALQRKFKIGFNRAARIMDQLCEAGVVGDSEGTKERQILMDMDAFEEFLKG